MDDIAHTATTLVMLTIAAMLVALVCLPIR